MSQGQNHVIDRTTLELVIEGTDHPESVQSLVRRCFDTRVQPRLEACFDAHTDARHHLRIERLDLDLGAMRVAELDRLFADRVMARMYAALPPSDVHAPARDPRWAEPSPVSPTDEPTATGSSEETLLEAWAHFIAVGRWPWWVAEAARSTPSACLEKLLDSIPETVRAHTVRSLSDARVLRRIIFQVEDRVLARLELLLQGASQPASSGSRPVTIEPPTADMTTDERFDTWCARLSPVDEPNHAASARDRHDSVVSPGAAVPIVGASGPAASADTRLHIDNGGLVLLWPFLAHLFETLGLLIDRRFVDDGARMRAACLLRYLWTASSEMPEPEMLLEKILCGLGPEDTLPHRYVAGEDEVAQIERLLEIVITRWEALGAISHDGFRVNWLAREALVSAHPGERLIQVEQRPQDVLLNRLPWPIGQIVLPWLDGPVAVVW